ncbi:MAG: D-2-hydroxyacid dehydrogenase [Bellilinea sp.]|jgi:phosphoglycerate dehydrogenase-like enzyme
MSTSPITTLATVNFPPELLEKVIRISPRIRLITHAARSAEEITPELWKQVEILYTDRVLPDPSLSPNLRWVQFHYAGIDHVAAHPLLSKQDIHITTLSGAAAPQVAEHVLLALLALGHKMPELFAFQARSEWPKDRWERFRALELRESTIGLVGYGSIGREVARLLRPFGARILAAKRDARQPEDSGYMPEGLGDPSGDLFTRLYPVQALRSMIKECDFVVVCAPLSPATRGLIGEAEIAAMKPSAFLVDVSRGGIVNPQALQKALEEKRIAGAALDVFTEEPLPPASPFWKLPNVIITPHISGISAHYNSRAIDLFVENLKRYLAGDSLYNRYDPELGY